EAACIDRFGTLRPAGEIPVLRRGYRLRQKFITPYTLSRTGSSSASSGVSRRSASGSTPFPSFIEARRACAGGFVGTTNDARPHQALGYLSPRQYRASSVLQTAS